MREVLTFPREAVLPEADRILASPSFAGKPNGAGGVSKERTDRLLPLLREALSCFSELVRPVGMYHEVNKQEFVKTLRRETETIPIDYVYPKAARLALFAVTIGETVSRKIAELFASNDYVLACLLDEAASQGAERAADLTQEVFRGCLTTEVVERYSPGYCGWNVSSQEPLFAILDPSAIGIRLNESCLMDPLKSISGVFIAGEESIHRVRDSFSFCEKCTAGRCIHRRK